MTISAWGSAGCGVATARVDDAEYERGEVVHELTFADACRRNASGVQEATLELRLAREL
jgi:hypothetical protein